jgi:hypothetical protein
MKHVNGPGLKVLSTRKWYGGGYCGICGTRGDELVPMMVRYWDPDDGWRSGVLCTYCGEEASARGPRPTDYAWTDEMASTLPKSAKIDILAADGDEDACYAETGLD